MSISTRTGDNATTSLMFGKRVRKDDLRVQTYGVADELAASISLAMFNCPQEVLCILTNVQKSLIALMSELATSNDDFARLQNSKIELLSDLSLQFLDNLVNELEKKYKFSGWVFQFDTLYQSHLNLSRAICRRLERQITTLHTSGENVRDIVFKYINRLSDVLFLLSVVK